MFSIGGPETITSTLGTEILNGQQKLIVCTQNNTLPILVYNVTFLRLYRRLGENLFQITSSGKPVSVLFRDHVAWTCVRAKLCE